MQEDEDAPWVYGPKERMWVDEDGVLRHARPEKVWERLGMLDFREDPHTASRWTVREGDTVRVGPNLMRVTKVHEPDEHGVVRMTAETIPPP